MGLLGRLPKFIEAQWDKGEAYVGRHRRKSQLLGFLIVTLPQWGPSAKSFYWDTISPKLTTTEFSGIDFSWLGWSSWNWLTLPVGLFVIWRASKPAKPIAVKVTESPESPKDPTVDASAGASVGPPPAPVSAAVESDEYPTVQLVKHTNASDEAYDAIRRLFADASYRVLGNVRSELPIHDRGVWLHGGTFNDRAHAKWGLATLGIEPRNEYSGEKPEYFQVIVGACELAPVAELRVSVERLARELDAMTKSRDQAASTPRAGESGTHARIRTALQEVEARRIRVKPEPDMERLKSLFTGGPLKGASKAAIAQGMKLRVFIVPNKGGTPGGLIRVENETPNPIDGVRFVITDLRVWDERHSAFVTHPDIYANSSTFPGECIRHHRQTLHCGVPGDYGLLRVEGNRLRIEGSHEYQTTRDGLWQMNYRVGPDDKAFIESKICFEWKASDDAAKPPTLEGRDCPAPSPYDQEFTANG